MECSGSDEKEAKSSVSSLEKDKKIIKELW